MSLAIGVAVIALAFIAVNSLRAPRLSPAEQTVQSLLELRARNATDAALYERYIESTSVAAALSEDSTAKRGGGSPIPAWDRPRVSKETSAGTEVLVAWRASKAFKDWPASTVFVVALRNGRWMLVDAVVSAEPSGASSASVEASGAK